MLLWCRFYQLSYIGFVCIAGVQGFRLVVHENPQIIVGHGVFIRGHRRWGGLQKYRWHAGKDRLNRYRAVGASGQRHAKGGYYERSQNPFGL